MALWMLYGAAEKWGVEVEGSVSRWWTCMQIALVIRSIACMDWVLGKLKRERVEKLEGIGGVLNGSVKDEEAVLLIHANGLLIGGAGIDWGVLVASREIGVEKIG